MSLLAAIINNISSSSYKKNIIGIFFLIFHIIIAIYYTFAYYMIPSDLKLMDLSILFLITLFIKWIEAIIMIAHTKDIVCHHNIYFFSPLGIAYGINFLIGVVYLSIYKSGSSAECGIYSDIKIACIALRIEFVTILVLIAIAGIITIVLLSVFIVECYDYLSFFTNVITHQNTDISLNNSYTIVLQRKNLVITTIPPIDNICSICVQESIEGNLWKELTCAHKFHPDCIDPWIQKNNSCPMCRQYIIDPSEFNVPINENITNNNIEISTR